ncbi:vWA domain-containing protein [Lutibacter flavus]|uniref:Ca-activated chloride channel family protein n=1 Tax=Lutibacter flavus TaxID=691689 RepID=A0A238VUM2_9FLAO|nr:VWA domain-containing protein [Lutibacter flavus]SNR38030.1 Ca-activated chloride channel family protein [Lutibacter flavus]
MKNSTKLILSTKKIIILTFSIFLGLISCDTLENELVDTNSYSSQYEGFPAISLPGDKYNEYTENPFMNVAENPVSKFSTDADGASYANVRRFIQQDKQLPPKGAIRTEELLNYFQLDYKFNNTSHPITLNGEVSECPWNGTHKLVRIGLKGKPISKENLPASNFVFLIDVSGSMGSEDKLELLKNGFKYFVDELSSNDRVAIVTYAGSAGVVLESTSGDEKQKIKNAINSLGSGGSTAGAEGIITAYEIAQQHLIANGNNRIVIGTDGDFNVGPSSQEELIELIEEKRELGIFLTVLGVGRGNLNDASLEQIANNGNGTYEYIDNLEQLKKVFIYDYNKFYTVAKDVKIQVEFNPNNVEAYRLIGYENRALENEDFEDDQKDAGEIGSNQNVTVLYEIIPKNNTNSPNTPTFTIDFRYKNPDSDTSNPLELEIFDTGKTFNQSTDFMKFTSSVASFSMLLSDSEYKGTSNYNTIINWLNSTNLNDEHGFKAAFKELVKEAKEL